MQSRWSQRLFIVAAVLTLANCEPSVGPSLLKLDPVSLSVVSGDAQTGMAGAQLSLPLVVQMTKPDGTPQRGQILNFNVIAGSGTVTGGVALTDQAGFAQEWWTLGKSTRETQRVEVISIDPQSGERRVFATFIATVVAGAPARMIRLVADDQTAAPGSAVPVSPAVRIEDKYGNPVANVGVQFTVAGNGSITGSETASDLHGIAQVGSWILGPQGSDTLTARTNAVGVVGNPTVFFARVAQ